MVNSKKSKLLCILLLSIITISSLSSCYLLPKEEEPLAPPLLQPAEVKYVTQIVERGNIQKTITMRGKFKSSFEILLSFEDRGGYVRGIYVKNGQDVKKGDPIMDLDIDKLARDKEQAYFDYKIAKLNYERVSNADEYTKEIASIQKSRAYSVYEEASELLDKSQLFAPIDGKITYMSRVTIGEWISARSTVVKISDPGQLYLLVQGDDANSFDIDDEINVTLIMKDDDIIYKGKVVQTPFDTVVDIALDYEEPTAIIEVENIPMDKITINSEAKVELILANRENVIILKRSTVKNFNGRTYVHLLIDDVKVERDVQLGLSTQTRVEIVEGLDDGDEIILR